MKIAYQIKLEKEVIKKIKKYAVEMDMNIGDFVGWLIDGFVDEVVNDYIGGYDDFVKESNENKENEVNNMKVKICTKCNKEKPDTAEYFWRAGSKDKDKLRPYCKECGNNLYEKNRIRSMKINFNEYMEDKRGE